MRGQVGNGAVARTVNGLHQGSEDIENSRPPSEACSYTAPESRPGIPNSPGRADHLAWRRSAAQTAEAPAHLHQGTPLFHHLDRGRKRRCSGPADGGPVEGDRHWRPDAGALSHRIGRGLPADRDLRHVPAGVACQLLRPAVPAEGPINSAVPCAVRTPCQPRYATCVAECRKGTPRRQRAAPWWRAPVPL